MNNEENTKIVVKEVVREIPKKEKRKIQIKFPGPIKLALYALIIFALLGGSIIGIKKIFDRDEKVLKLGLKDAGELVTQTCHTVVLEDSKESLSFFDWFDIPFTESRQIFSYDFDVDASIDFSQIEIANIDDNKQEVTIKIPHSRVYKVYIDADSFKSYLDTDGLFTRIDITEHNEALLEMEKIAKYQCTAGNLLGRADENAKKLIASMIKSEKKYKDYNVIFDYFEDSNQEETQTEN